MRSVPILLAVAAAIALSGCAVVSVAGTAASVTGTVISTTAEVTGDVIGAAARTVTGSGSKSDQESK
jgi:hypothetical protein